MNSERNKKLLIFGGTVLGATLILGLLWYYQQQGFLKLFPTAEDRANKQILKIDRTKFRPAEGLTSEQFESEIKKLEEQKKKVLENPKDSQTWFSFGYTKEFLNDHEGAAAAWERSFALQPLNFVTALNLANTYQYFIKDLGKAETYYYKVLELRSDYTPAYQGLMDLYRYNLKEKQNLYEPLMLQAIEKDSVNQLTYYVGLVEFFASQNDIAKAKIYLAKVQELKPAEAAELRSVYPALQ